MAEGPRRVRPLATLLVAALVTPFFGAPTNIPASPDLDSSWQAAIVHLASHRRAFGEDVVFSFGPLGFLYAISSAGDLLEVRLVGDLVVKSLMVFLLVRRAFTAGPGVGALVLFHAVWLVAGNPDALAFIALWLVGVALIDDESPGVRWTALGLGVVLALEKITFLLLGTAAVVLAVGHAALTGRFRRAAALGGGAAAGVTAAWLASGQPLRSFPSFLRSGLVFSAGYEEAMYLPAATGVTPWAVLAALALASLVAWRALRRQVAPAVGVLGLLTLGLVWKHALVRGDHVPILLGFVPVVALLSAGAPPPRQGRITLAALCAVAVGAAWAGLYVIASNPARHPLYLAERLVRRAARIVQPFQTLAAQRAQVAEVRRQVRLPEVSRLVGTSSVDVLGHEQAVVLFNGLDYRPRPVLQGYGAYTPELMRRNEEHVLSSRAAPYVLLKLQTIDGRYAAGDDAGALEALLRRYELAAVEGGYSLWRAQARAPLPPRELLREGRAAFGERLALPDDPAVLVSFDVQPTLLGRLRTAALRPAAVEMALESDDGTRRFRLLRLAARRPFLVAPRLASDDDLLGLLEGAPHRARAVTLEVADGDRRFYRSTFSYRVYRTEAVAPRTAIAVSARDWRYWMFPLAPDPVELTHAPNAFTVSGQGVLLAVPPSRLVFRLPSTPGRLVARFGLPETVYRAPYLSDGAAFLAETRDGTVLWRRLLQPASVPADRGLQEVLLDVPWGVGNEIVLRADCGPRAACDYDWTYWGGVRFEPTPQGGGAVVR